MKKRWSVAASLLLLFVLAVGGIGAACGGDDNSSGGSKDEDKIKSRMNSFVDHINKGDIKGLLNDVPPESRKDCDESKIKEGIDLFKAAQVKVKSIENVNVEGSNATADITFSGNLGGPTQESTESQKFVKNGGTWYIDTEGKSCADFFS